MATDVTMPPSFPIDWGDRSYRISVAKYREMVLAGIITKDDGVELLEGQIVKLMGKHPPRVLANKLMFSALLRAIPAGWHVAKEDPVETSTSVPEPDCLVLRGGARDYGDRTPGPSDVALAVEVADSSLVADQTLMKRIYAAAAVPFYWIVNLRGRSIEVHADPTGSAEAPDYGSTKSYSEDESVPLVIGGREVARIPVRELLP